MANQATLSDVIERLRAEGQLTRNTGANSIKMVRVELSAQTTALQEMLKIMQAQEERFKLGRAGQDTGGPDGGNGNRDRNRTDEDNSSNPILAALGALRGLGLLGKAAVLAIGGTLGLVIGQFKIFDKLLGGTLAKIGTSIKNLGTSITTRFVALGSTISASLQSAGATVTKAIIDFGSWLKGLMSSVGSRISNMGKIGKMFVATVSYIGNAIAGIGKLLGDAIKTIAGAVKSTMGIGSAIGKFISPIKTFLGSIMKVAGAVGKVFPLFAIALAAFDTIKGAITGFMEGGIVGGLAGAIKGLFNSLIAAPLDLIKSLVSWVAEKLGFENFASFLDSFSFTGFINAVFGFVEGAWNWIKDLFADPVGTLKETWNAATGGISSLGSWIWSKVEGVWDWIKGLFGNLVGMFPSMEELKAALLDMMPDWMRRLVGAPERSAGQIVDEKLEEQRAELEAARDRRARSLSGENIYYGREGVGQEEDAAIIAELEKIVEATDPRRAAIQGQIDTLLAERNALIESAAGSGIDPDTSYFDGKIAEFQAELRESSFRSGTPGFMDFGPGALAMLHGMEAVVPRNTPAGEFLANNFDENFNPIMQRIASVETAAMQQSQAPTIVVNAPTVAPVNNNIGGSTSVSNNRVTAIGTGSGGIGLGRFAN
jgi:hypothetical protein